MKCNYKAKQIDSLLKSKQGKIASFEQCISTLDDYECLFLYLMNKEFGFGRKRLQRIYEAMQRTRDELSEFYCADDIKDVNIDLYAVKQMLKDKGIHPDQLTKFLEKENT